jgi:hypothetical protein
MKVKLLRASNTVKEIEFAATLPPLEIQRLAVDLMFENFERTPGKHHDGYRAYSAPAMQCSSPAHRYAEEIDWPFTTNVRPSTSALP